MGLSAQFDHFQRRLTQAWQDRAVTLKAASFAMVGVVNTVIDYCVFLSGYYLLGLPLVPANVLSWLVAVSGSYVMNSYVTFAVESGRQLRWRAYAAFVASGTAGLVTHTTVLVAVSRSLPVPAAWLRRPLALWRYHELVPVRRARDIVRLAEPVTPILTLPGLARTLAAGDILVKAEGRLPAGSFKARGLARAVSMAKALGVGHMA